MIHFLDLPHGWAAERCEAYRIIAAIDYTPEPWLWKAVGESPERREPWVDLARHYAGQNRWQEAAMAFYNADMRDDDTIYTTDSQCWGVPFEALRDQIAVMV